MKRPILTLFEIGEKDRPAVGGKASTLARLARQGFPVPPAICVPTHFYLKYLKETGIGEKISLELSRKDSAQMRWEEVWDCALRIRNFFLRTPMPPSLTTAVAPLLENRFGNGPVAVRSSAPGEDDAQSSFAGLHESFVNVRGCEDILLHIRLVWASLWSDSALLYRQELGLDVRTSTMAVIVQELIQGERSGVAFSMDPQNESRGIVESVWGLNQGLVDGTVEPDRWFMDRDTGEIIRHEPPSQREKSIRPLSEGIALVPLETTLADTPPLTAKDAAMVFSRTMELERYFGAPQDMEWTFRDQALYLLQARPITTLGGKEEGDRRSWYMSLRRSYENLAILGDRIENELLPAMERQTDELAARDLSLMTDGALAAETRSRMKIVEKWEKIYWDEFIPFAHGVRLFGQFYNDRFRPEDPFVFVSLLRGQNMKSTGRNRELRRLAQAVLPYLPARSGTVAIPEELGNDMKNFLRKFGPLPGVTLHENDLDGLMGFLDRIGNSPLHAAKTAATPSPTTETEFLNGLPEIERTLGQQILLLARKSWKIRDDDNIYLGRIQAQLQRCLRETAKRIEVNRGKKIAGWSSEDLLTGLLDPVFKPSPPDTDRSHEEPEPRTVQVRQVRGQPASPGIATGRARVIFDPGDIKGFRSGEILVCDAIDPTMTFIVPMASAIVERRGGMLIHGAIIAREYGIPCITGIPDVTAIVRTGDTLTVDGHLGLLVVTGRENSSGSSLSEEI